MSGACYGLSAVVIGAESPYASIVVDTLLGEGAAVLVVGLKHEPPTRFAKMQGVSTLPGEADGSDAATILVATHGPTGAPDIVITCPLAIAPTGGPPRAVELLLPSATAWTEAATLAICARGQGGAIVNVTGLCGLGGWPGWAGIGAAFAGIHNLNRAMAVDYATNGVRVNALVPGIDIHIAAAIAAHSGQPIEAVRARIPMRQFMPPEALGNALLYLVHPSSSYVTGETLVVDGGWDCWGRLSGKIV